MPPHLPRRPRDWISRLRPCSSIDDTTKLLQPAWIPPHKASTEGRYTMKPSQWTTTGKHDQWEEWSGKRAPHLGQDPATLASRSLPRPLSGQCAAELRCRPCPMPPLVRIGKVCVGPWPSQACSCMGCALLLNVLFEVLVPDATCSWDMACTMTPIGADGTASVA